MPEDIFNNIKSLHESNVEFVLVFAGAGSHAIDRLLSVPGASKTVLEIMIPYSNNSLDEFLGLKPEKYVSLDTNIKFLGKDKLKKIKSEGIKKN